MPHCFCTNCLYDLSATIEPRCPECGRGFDPRNLRATTLASRNVARWAVHHVVRWLEGWTHRREDRMFCRECWTDLRPHRHQEKCPVCEAWFDVKEQWTYRRSDHALARVQERFRHVCIWRGVLLAGVLLVLGIVDLITQTARLPGASRYGWHTMLRLEGAPAIMMGIAWLGAALALHARYFWGRVEPVWRFADIGLVLGIVMITIGWGCSLYWAIASMN
jgi:hypothetical protein